MNKQLKKIGLIGSVLALAVAGGSIVLALSPQANAHAQAANNTATNNITASSDAQNSHQPSQTTNAQANGRAHLVAAHLRACQHREKAINNIMNRIDTRGKNQLTLFNTIATRVESFYKSKSKTVGNYDQLVAALASARTKATIDLGSVHNNSTFSCSSSDPKGRVNEFQNYLKIEITDLKNYRTAIKNLIVAVASANGVSVSGAHQTSVTQGGQH